MRTRLDDDVTAVGLAVDPRSDGPALYPAARVGKEVVRASTPRPGGDRRGQLAVLLFERSKGGIAFVARIDINDGEAGRCSDRQPEIGARPLSPPLANLRLVGGRVLEAVLGSRMLAYVLAVTLAAGARQGAVRCGDRIVQRKDTPPRPRMPEGLFEHKGVRGVGGIRFHSTPPLAISDWID